MAVWISIFLSVILQVISHMIFKTFCRWSTQACWHCTSGTTDSLGSHHAKSNVVNSCKIERDQLKHVGVALRTTIGSLPESQIRTQNLTPAPFATLGMVRIHARSCSSTTKRRRRTEASFWAQLTRQRSRRVGACTTALWRKRRSFSRKSRGNC